MARWLESGIERIRHNEDYRRRADCLGNYRPCVGWIYLHQHGEGSRYRTHSCYARKPTHCSSSAGSVKRRLPRLRRYSSARYVQWRPFRGHFPTPAFESLPLNRARFLPLTERCCPAATVQSRSCHHSLQSESNPPPSRRLPEQSQRRDHRVEWLSERRDPLLSTTEP